jgi:hypothetical protein
MACTTEMIVTGICEPTSITDQRKLWAAFVTGYINASTFSTSGQVMIFISPNLDFEGVGTTAVTTSTSKALILNSRSIITEEIFHDCGSAGATSE